MPTFTPIELLTPEDKEFLKDIEPGEITSMKVVSQTLVDQDPDPNLNITNLDISLVANGKWLNFSVYWTTFEVEEAVSALENKEYWHVLDWLKENLT
jgi:hypothetical protein